jgi:hypothetical protein
MHIPFNRIYVNTVKDAYLMRAVVCLYSSMHIEIRNGNTNITKNWDYFQRDNEPMVSLQILS